LFYAPWQISKQRHGWVFIVGKNTIALPHKKRVSALAVIIDHLLLGIGKVPVEAYELQSPGVCIEITKKL
jgi:hypothetical protein